jgi:arylsulfatase
MDLRHVRIAVMAAITLDWFCENVFLQYSAPPLLMEWLESFKEFPPRQKPASFSIDQVLEKLIPKD